MKEARSKDPTVRDVISTKCPEKAKLCRGHRAAVAGGGRDQGVSAVGYRLVGVVSVWIVEMAAQLCIY